MKRVLGQSDHQKCKSAEGPGRFCLETPPEGSRVPDEKHRSRSAALGHTALCLERAGNRGFRSLDRLDKLNEGKV